MFKRKSLFEKNMSLPLFEPEENDSSSGKGSSYENEQHPHFYKERHQREDMQKSQPRIFENENFSSQNYHFRNEQGGNTETQEQPAPPSSVMTLPSEEPETTLGQGVSFNGKLQFERMLRIDGHFEGELSSEGKLVVGPTGVVKSNIDLNEAIIEGVVEGNVTVKGKLELRGEAKVVGDITAGVISVDEGVTLDGYVKVSSSLSFDEDMDPSIKSSKVKKRKSKS